MPQKRLDASALKCKGVEDPVWVEGAMPHNKLGASAKVRDYVRSAMAHTRLMPQQGA